MSDFNQHAPIDKLSKHPQGRAILAEEQTSVYTFVNNIKLLRRIIMMQNCKNREGICNQPTPDWVNSRNTPRVQIYRLIYSSEIVTSYTSE